MFERFCTILLANIVFYYKTVFYKYVSDDIPVSQRKPIWKNKYHKRWLQLIGEIRTTPDQDHFLTTVLHGICCGMIYLAFGATDVSFLAALLMSFCPQTNQVSVWIAGRGYVLPTICLLTAMTVPFLAPIFLYICSWWTIGFLAPVAALGTPQVYILLWMPLIWILHKKKFSTAVNSKLTKESYVADKKMHWGKLILAVKTIGFYFSFCLFPFRITFYHNFLQSCSGNTLMQKEAYRINRYFYVGLASILLTWYMMIFHWGNLTTAGLVWFMAGILPFSNLRRNNQEAADRFCYLACVGLMVALATVLIHFPYLAVAWLTMYAVRMWYGMEMYKDDYWIVEHAVIEDPYSWYAWHIRGMKRWDVGSFKEALIMWVMARMISPKEFKVLYNIALSLRVLNNIKESDDFLAEANANIVAGQEQEAKRLLQCIRDGKAPLLI